jgi:hypothetical protein
LKPEDVYAKALTFFRPGTPDRFMEALFSRQRDILALPHEKLTVIGDEFYKLIANQIVNPKSLEVWKCLGTNHQVMVLHLLALNKIIMGIKDNDVKLISHYFL